MKPRLLLVALLGLSLIQPALLPEASAAAGKNTRTTKATKSVQAKPAAKKAAPAAKKAATRAAAKKTAAAPAAKTKAKAASTRQAKKAVASKGRVVDRAAAAKASRAKRVAASRVAPARVAAKAAPVRVSLRKPAAVASVAALSAAPLGGAAADEIQMLLDAQGRPALGSNAFLVVNQRNGEILLERNSTSVLPIASITKLMTAMVVLDARQRLSEELVVSPEDIDTLKGTGSRLAMGTRLTREEMLRLALMSSENRAASALGRYYPGGRAAFINAMNAKAKLLGMWNTRFHDSTGLNPANVSSPRDLAKLVSASAAYPLIRQFSTTHEHYVPVAGRMQRFGNTNGLVKSPEWQIGVSKTGYISEAGRCLVMQAWMHGQPVLIVLMDSTGRYTRTADAQRVRKWIEAAPGQRLAKAPAGWEG